MNPGQFVNPDQTVTLTFLLIVNGEFWSHDDLDIDILFIVEFMD